MTELKYKTIDNSSPQGKSRVYFTCHPSDFKGYFDPITDDILKRQNCAVFYLEPDAVIEDNSEYEMDLSQMQLIVVPITTRLLTMSNRAMIFDVPYALKQHIPVLPLMQESGLDDFFTKKFGDLQYLDKNNIDATEISYDEKLEKYLNSVIVGDELAEKIRGAFDAYVFLSYRKKDREYAQQLMRLIHNVPFCRDIAIWYDEFLTPGENFTDAIKEALEKSELFALTVTPNLVNEKNYVMTTEYPLARKLNKKILPTEMLPTDKEKLSEYYDSIPEIIGCSESKKLSEYLLNQLKDIVLLQNDSDPQHIFFIGLAFLDGVDVEINYDRALSLIQRSAENGFIDAIEKLISMYDNGKGVAKNFQEAANWCKILVEELRKGEDKRKLYEALDKWGKHLESHSDLKKPVFTEMLELAQYLGDYEISYSYEKLGDNERYKNEDEAREYYQKSIDASERITEDYYREHPGVYWYIAQKLLKVADFEVFYENPGIADIYIEKMIVLCEKWNNYWSSNLPLDILMRYLIEYANEKERRCYYDGAIEYYKKAMEVYQKLEHEDQIENLYILITCLIKLGRTENKRSNYDNAILYFNNAAEIIKINNENKNFIDLYYCYEGISIAEESRKNYEAASSIYKRIIDSFNSEHNNGTIIEHKYSERMADLEVLCGRYESASKYYSQAILSIEASSLPKEETEYCLSICETYEKAGDIELKLNRPDNAAEYYSKALNIEENLEKNVAKNPYADLYITKIVVSLSHNYIHMGIAEKAKGNENESIKYFNKALTIRSNPSSKLEEWGTYYDIYEIELRSNNGNVFDCLQNNILLDEQLAQGVNTIEGWIYLADRYRFVGHCLRYDEDVDEYSDKAGFYYQKAIEVIENFLCQDKPKESFRQLSEYYSILGFEKKYKDPDESKKCFQKSAEYTEKLIQSYSDTLDVKEIIRLYDRISESMEEIKDIATAVIYYRKSLHLIQNNKTERLNKGEKRTLLERLTRVYIAEEKLENYNEAIDLAKTAVKYSEQLCEESKDARDYRERPEKYFDAGRIEFKRNKLDKAFEYYNQGIFYSELLLKNELSTFWYSTYLAYKALGEIEESRGNIDSACSQYIRIINLETEFIKADGAVDKKIIYETFNKIGDLKHLQSNFSSANFYYKEAINVLKKMAEETRNKYDWMNVLYRCNDLAKFEREARLYETALEYYQESLLICEDKLSDESSKTLYLSIVYHGIAECEKELGHTEAASEYYKKYVMIDEQRLIQEGTSKAFDLLNIILVLAGTFEKELYVIDSFDEHLDNAAEYFNKAIEIIKLHENNNYSNSTDMLSANYLELSRIEKLRGNIDLAKQICQIVIDMDQNNAEETQTDNNYYHIAISYYYLGILDENDICEKNIQTALCLFEDLVNKSNDNQQYFEWQTKVAQLFKALIERNELQYQLENLRGIFKRKQRIRLKDSICTVTNVIKRLINEEFERI